MIRGVVVVEDGDANQTYSLAINVRVCRYRGINVVAAAGGTPSQVEILVYSGQSNAAPLIRRKLLDIAANLMGELDEILRLDQGIASGDGLFVEVITDANIVADSLSCITYFNSEYS